MSQVIPVGKKVVEAAVKHGPKAKVAWDVAGKAGTEAVRRRQARAMNRRMAFAKAQTVSEGSVLRQLNGDQVVWVVYSGDEPITSYPTVVDDLRELTRHAKLTARITPEDHDRSRALERAKRAVRRVRHRE